MSLPEVFDNLHILRIRTLMSMFYREQDKVRRQLDAKRIC
jgi:hypothetical protein